MGTDLYDKLRAPPAFVRDGLASQTSLQGDFLGDHGVSQHGSDFYQGTACACART